MKFEFKISVESTRDEGKFASRDEIESLIQEELENANPGTIFTDSGASYSLEWEVEGLEPKK